MVSTHLKNISPIGSFPRVGMERIGSFPQVKNGVVFKDLDLQLCEKNLLEYWWMGPHFNKWLLKVVTSAIYNKTNPT